MVSAATLFPNLSFVHNWPQVDASGTVAPFISLRQWQPVSERETEVLSWFAVDASAPEEFKENSYRAYLMCFGTLRHVRAGRRGELGLDHRHGSRIHGTAAEPQQPDGPDFVRPADQAPAELASPGPVSPTRGSENSTSATGCASGAITWSASLAASIAGRHGYRDERGGSPVSARRPLAYADPAHLAAHQFLVEEAALLDAGDFAGWLELLPRTSAT